MFSPEKEFTALQTKYQSRAVDRGVWICCLNCEHWHSKPNELCGLAGTQPPAEVIVIGCPEWVQMIPF